MMTIGLGNATRAKIIDAVIGQLSDGMWENSPAMNKYWQYCHIQGTDLIIDNVNWCGGFKGRNEDWIKHWFASKLKKVVQEEVGNNKQGWDRNNMDISIYISYNNDITVSHCYECYEYLLGRTGHKYAFQANSDDSDIDKFKIVIIKAINNICADLNINADISAFNDWINSILDFFEKEFDHFNDTFDDIYFEDLRRNLAEKNELIWPNFESAAYIMKTIFYDNSDLLKDATQEYGLSMAPDDCFKAIYYKSIRPVILSAIYDHFNTN